MVIRVILSIILVILVVFVLFYLFVFRRNPHRTIPPGNSIVSPADGKIIGITNTAELSTTVPKGLLGNVRTLCHDVAKECTLVSIMLSPFDVHFQRAPIEGTIISVKHTPGTFVNAVTTRSLAILENEKNEILIEKGKKRRLRVKVIQIAGCFARRIRCFVTQGERLAKGQKLGFIDLGSQVTLILPKRTLNVSVGQRVVGGETVLAHE